MAKGKVLITWFDDPEKEPIIRGWMSYYNRRGIEYEIVQLNHHINRSATVWETLRFIFALFFKKYTFVLSNDVYTAFWALFVCKLRRKKLVYNVQELHSEFMPWDKQSITKRRIIIIREKFLYRYADILVFPIEMRKNYIRDKYKLDEDKLVVFENLPTYNVTEDYPDLDKKYLVYSGTVANVRPIEILGPLSVFLKNHGITVLLISKKNKQVETLLDNYSNVEHISYLEPQKLMGCLSKCYLGIAIYGKGDRNNLYCAPVKFYDYIMAELPFLIVDNPTVEYLRGKYGKILEMFNIDSYESLQEQTLKMINDYDIYKSNIAAIDKSSVTFRKYDDDMDKLHARLIV